MILRLRVASVAVAVAVACLSNPLPGLTAGEASPEPTPPAFEERLKVILVEVVVRATDRKGRAVTDLKPDQLTVLEGKQECKLAHLESLSAGGPDRATESAPPPTTLYDEAGRAVEAEQGAVVVSPAQRRRVVLVFDAPNSKVRIRTAWKSAALDWVRDSMRAGDHVGIVVFTTTPVWLRLPTDDRDLVLATLEPLDLERFASDRSRRQEMSRLVDEILMCAESSEIGLRRDSPTGAEGGASGASDEASCAFRIAEPYVRQWAVESSETVNNLRALTGQLAALEGRKEVLLFSEGIIPDAAAAAVNAMLSTFGANRIPLQKFTYDLRDDSFAQLSALHDAARAAGVVYFTFDTRSGAERGHFETLPYARPQGTQTLGINPWVEMYRDTSGTLGSLAERTGGRSYYGTGDLTRHVTDAVDSYFGVYNLGYYRDATVGEPGKLRIRVARNDVDLKYSKQSGRPHVTRAARLDLSIRRPEFSGRGDRQWLTVVLEMNSSELPLRKEGGAFGCQLGAFVQAVRPDGSIADEAFEDAVVAIPRSPSDTSERAEPFRQSLRLELPPGPYRLIARISDDRQGIAGRRTVDITLAPGSVRAGMASKDPGEEGAVAVPDPQP